MADKKKVNHFVPQFHLRGFGSERAISVFNMRSRRHIHEASIKKQCQRNYLYGRDPKIEDALCVLEGEAATAIRRLTGDEAKPYSSHYHKMLLTFLVMQHMRTPSAARHSLAARKVLASTLTRPHPGEPHVYASNGLELNLDEDIDHLRENIAMAVQVAPVISDLRFKIIDNKSPIEFITSDSPVILFNQAGFGAKGIGITGFTQFGLQIFFPLDRRRLLIMYDNDAYIVGSSEEYRFAVKNQRDVERLNRLQMLEADENLYYSGDGETGKIIDEIPLEHRRKHEDAPAARRAISENQRSILIHHFSEPLTYELKLSFINLRPAVKRRPLLQRIHNWRPRAMQIAESIMPHPPDDRPEGSATSWRVIDE